MNKQLLEILACPACKSGLTLAHGTLTCSNARCGLRFPIRDEIPVLLIEEAERPQAEPAAGK